MTSFPKKLLCFLVAVSLLLTLCPTAHAESLSWVTIRHAVGTELSVTDSTGAVYTGTPVDPGEELFSLPQGESCILTASRSGAYFTEISFTAADGLTLTAAEPICEDWLIKMQASGAGTASSSLQRSPYTFYPSFSKEKHDYEVPVPDVNTTFAIWLTSSRADASISVRYQRLKSGTPENRAVSSGKTSGTLLAGFVEPMGQTNHAKIQLSVTENGVRYYQEYRLTARRELHVVNAALSCQGDPVQLDPVFDRDIHTYTADVPQAVTQVQLNLSLLESAVYLGYEAELRIGAEILSVPFANNTVSASIPLDPYKETETLNILMKHGDPLAIPGEYQIVFHKKTALHAVFAAEPAQAVVSLVDETTGRAVMDEGSGFALLEGHRYAYTVTCPGYIAQTGSFTATEPVTITVSLREAPQNPAIHPEITAQWPFFRGSETNNASVAAPIPVRDRDAALYWAVNLNGSDRLGDPILVNNRVITYAGNWIYALDPVDGSVLQSGIMADRSPYAMNTPAYADGMIFVGLAGGKVQAFNADTLESLWLYTDPLGGEPNCPITSRGGYVYTGFWNSETGNANFVCLTITDEDPASSLEAKTASWTRMGKGGYYWAGACIRENCLLVGTDDGEEGYLTGHASVLSLDPRTGKNLDTLTLSEHGDIRSGIVYDAETDSVYFTSKGGYFYGVRVTGDGRFLQDTLWPLKLTNGTEDPLNPAVSTSTPVVHNGRAYIGVRGQGQFGPYSGHNLSVIDLADHSLAYQVPTQGDVQSSGLLTNAYEEDSGAVYVYFLENILPGKLRVLEDRPGQTAPSLTTTETYLENGRQKTAQTAYVLFSPVGAHAQYCISSPISDENGTLYFKNDSGHLMALGSTVQSLRFAAMPRTNYRPGETFDPAGMKVEAVYTNGTVRDVTDYVRFSDAPLTKDDAFFQIRFENQLYQNFDGMAGSLCQPITAVLELTISDDVIHTHSFGPWTPTGDGSHEKRCACGETVTENCELTEEMLIAPSCTEPGTAHEVCDICKWSRGTYPVEALGHQWGEWQETVPASCTTEGRRERICERDERHCETETIPAGSHVPVREPGYPATCKESGMTDAYICSLCGELLEPHASIPAIPCACAGFEDARVTAWYHDAVDYAVYYGYMSGTGAGTFNPTGTLTRAELVQVFYNLSGVSWDQTQTEFADVPSTAWYARAISWASSNGVVSGVSPTAFGPKIAASREQVFVILFRYAGGQPLKEDYLSSFTDQDRISSWARAAVNWAVGNDYVHGSGGKMTPTDQMTRAELAQLIRSFLTK